ncbi:hypothetical protein GCM10023339_17850 [Alloalcanivorax gelatiniphagus]
MLMKVVAGVATLVVGFLGGVQLQQVVASSGDSAAPDRAIDPRAHASETVLEDCPVLPSASPYPVNDNGMTYGSGAGIDEDDRGPDLIAAQGTNGRCGFIRATDRDHDQPRDPQEAVEHMADLDPGGRDIPLYAQDGATVIGELHISPGTVLTSPAPQAPRSSP